MEKNAITALSLQTQSDSLLIVLAAAPVTQDFVSVVNVSTPAMLPYMGRPLIYQTIVNHIKKHSGDVIVALPRRDARLQEFLTLTFGTRLNLVLVPIDSHETGTPSTSLQASAQAAAAHGLANRPAYIVYGDIYFEPAEEITYREPVAFVDDYVSSDKYSYFAVTSGEVRHVDAQVGSDDDRSDLSHQPLLTDVGAYWVPSLKEIMRDDEGERGDGTVGSFLADKYQGQLRLTKVRTWSDLGHLDTATQIRTRLIGAREFNSLVIDEARGLITKRSRKREKILQEINYYLHLPKALTIFYPRLHDFHVGKDAWYTLEYYSYRTLAEYYVFFSFPLAVWVRIVDRLISIHKELGSYRGREATAKEVEDFYLGKLVARMEDLSPNSAIRRLTDAPLVRLNDQVLKGWRHYRPLIEATVERISRSPRTAAIHGDLCFSNILYDPQTGLMKLIDPRGDFFDEGCYGDPRYDLAKLLHSIHGGYDYIMQEMYDLHNEGEHEFTLRLFRPKNAASVSQALITRLAAQTDYDIKDLLVLEAMLFLSMLPLHSDDEQRQKALYLTGIEILKEVSDADLH